MPAVAGEFAVWPPDGAVPVAVEGLYDGAGRGGYGYGPAFRGLRAAWRRGEEVFAEVALPEEAAAEAAAFGLHPALLDAALHAAGLAGPPDVRRRSGPGHGPDAVRVDRGVAARGGRVRAAGPAAAEAGGALSLAAADAAGAPVVSVDSLVSRPVAAGQLAAVRQRSAGRAVHAWTGSRWRRPARRRAGGRWPARTSCGWRPGWRAPGVDVRAYPDLAALAEAVAAGEPVPEVVLACAGAAAGRTAAGGCWRPGRRGRGGRGRRWGWCRSGWPRSGWRRRGWWW